jgi:hypothetical protein
VAPEKPLLSRQLQRERAVCGGVITCWGRKRKQPDGCVPLEKCFPAEEDRRGQVFDVSRNRDGGRDGCTWTYASCDIAPSDTVQYRVFAVLFQDCEISDHPAATDNIFFYVGKRTGSATVRGWILGGWGIWPVTINKHTHVRSVPSSLALQLLPFSLDKHASTGLPTTR